MKFRDEHSNQTLQGFKGTGTCFTQAQQIHKTPCKATEKPSPASSASLPQLWDFPSHIPVLPSLDYPLPLLNPDRLVRMSIKFPKVPLCYQKSLP